MIDILVAAMKRSDIVNVRIHLLDARELLERLRTPPDDSTPAAAANIEEEVDRHLKWLALRWEPEERIRMYSKSYRAKVQNKARDVRVTRSESTNALEG